MTGVQTCALPICHRPVKRPNAVDRLPLGWRPTGVSTLHKTPRLLVEFRHAVEQASREVPLPGQPVLPETGLFLLNPFANGHQAALDGRFTLTGRAFRRDALAKERGEGDREESREEHHAELRALKATCPRDGLKPVRALTPRVDGERGPRRFGTHYT